MQEGKLNKTFQRKTEKTLAIFFSANIIKKYPISGGNSVVECLLAKEDVASSSLVSRSIKKKVSGPSFLG